MIKKSQIINLDRFKKLLTLDKGGFGVVLQVEEKETGKLFAAKIPDIHQINYTNLSREIQILQLDHPSINKFIGFCPFDFEKERCPVILTEFCSNRSLKHVLNLKRSLKTLNAWTNTKKLINIYGIASAMAYLHSRNILHLDLKPSNILEDDQLYPQISDFGISQKNDGKPLFDNSTPTVLTGAPVYTAPELLTGNGFSTAADVYSFSLIVYEIITNEVPFQGPNVFDILQKVVQQGYRPDLTKKPIPRCFSDLILNCWCQDPKRRPTFDQIVHVLRNNSEFVTSWNRMAVEWYKKAARQGHEAAIQILKNDFHEKI